MSGVSTVEPGVGLKSKLTLFEPYSAVVFNDLKFDITMMAELPALSPPLISKEDGAGLNLPAWHLDGMLLQLHSAY